MQKAKTESEIRDDIIAYLHKRGIKNATKEKRLKDPDHPTWWAQADIYFTYKGIAWLLEVKRSAIENRTLAPVQKALGQSLHYLALAPYSDCEGDSVRAAIVVAADLPSDTFIESCERAGIEFWEWNNHKLTWKRSPTLHPLPRPLRSHHPLWPHVRKSTSTK